MTPPRFIGLQQGQVLRRWLRWPAWVDSPRTVAAIVAVMGLAAFVAQVGALRGWW